jgi:hypothetical protein
MAEKYGEGVLYNKIVNVDMLSFFFYFPPPLICSVFYVRYMGNVLFSCDGYVVTPVQVDDEVMGWKKMRLVCQRV